MKFRFRDGGGQLSMKPYGNDGYMKEISVSDHGIYIGGNTWKPAE